MQLLEDLQYGGTPYQKWPAVKLLSEIELCTSDIAWAMQHPGDYETRDHQRDEIAELKDMRQLFQNEMKRRDKAVIDGRFI